MLQLANSQQESRRIPSRLLLGSRAQGKRATGVERAIGGEECGRDTPRTGPLKTALKRKTRSRRRAQVVTSPVLDIDTGRGTVLSSNQTCRDSNKHRSFDEHTGKGRLSWVLSMIKCVDDNCYGTSQYYRDESNGRVIYISVRYVPEPRLATIRVRLSIHCGTSEIKASNSSHLICQYENSLSTNVS